jgi:hypothetical protein
VWPSSSTRARRPSPPGAPPSSARPGSGCPSSRRGPRSSPSPGPRACLRSFPQGRPA